MMSCRCLCGEFAGSSAVVIVLRGVLQVLRLLAAMAHLPLQRESMPLHVVRSIGAAAAPDS